MNKSKLVASGLLLAVFVSGLIVGGAANALADRTEDGAPTRARRPYHEMLRDTLRLSDGMRMCSANSLLS